MIETKFWVGDNITIGGNISAKITGIVVTNSGIEYRCSYFYEGSYFTNWLNDFEIATDKPTNNTIGYKGGS